MGSLGSPHGTCEPCYLQAHGVTSIVQYGISTYMIHPHALLYASLLGPYSLGECLSLIEQQRHTLPLLGDIITDPPHGCTTLGPLCALVSLIEGLMP